MASRLSVSPRPAIRTSHVPHREGERRRESSSLPISAAPENRRNRRGRSGPRILRVSNGGRESYLNMWRHAVDREKKERAFRRIAENDSSEDGDGDRDGGASDSDLERKSQEFKKILEVSEAERDRIQRMQVIDRAAAAISAARAILASGNSRDKKEGFLVEKTIDRGGAVETPGKTERGMWSRTIYVPQLEKAGSGTPGPDFWSWTPPQGREISSDKNGDLQAASESTAFPTLDNPVTEKDHLPNSLSIPFESKLSTDRQSFTLPPFQSLIEIEKKAGAEPSSEALSLNLEHDLEVISSAHAAEAAYALDKSDESSSYGVSQEGAKWWKQTGVEQRPDGVICRWTMTRGVTADGVVEWQDKYWEASDEFGYKELGSEKSGRDAAGNVWREFWRESMLQECGILHIEKTADKWGKNGKGDEWQEKWWEHYDASGKSEKWAHKWCSIDPDAQLEAGHAHVWHERWGEKYDGLGGSVKYTDKWAERCVDNGWDKWGDKWDEHFDPNGHGVKQGEKWWKGRHGDRWNRTWGEQHNASGWVHKYGKSSSGEHWDTHVQQPTWYERFPHYGFYHCFDNSVQLRAVPKPSEMP